MLTGYNTDVTYAGVTYHVQTEDKGLGNPVVLSLVYQGGTILAAKRTNYGELIREGEVDEAALSQMLDRQHRIIVAAIQSGKSDRLAELSRQHSAQGQAAPAEVRSAPAVECEAGRAGKGEPIVAPPVEPPAHRASHQTANSRAATPTEASLEQMISSYLSPPAPHERLRIELLSEPEFHAGDEVLVQAAVIFGTQRPAERAAVTLQVVGTRVAAQTIAGATDERGLVSFQVKLPVFTAGAAALILNARGPHGQEAEAKFLIRRK